MHVFLKALVGSKLLGYRSIDSKIGMLQIICNCQAVRHLGLNW